MKNIFVPGLTAVQREELESIAGSEEMRFHGLMDYDSLVKVTVVDFEKLLGEAREELGAFDGSVDAIIAHWDFPVSIIAPMLAAERGLPAPSLESLLKCEHKYWSRLEQLKSIPEVVPGFCAFDPFADDALDEISLEYPFWIKPVKAHSSDLGFMITNEDEFWDALEEIRSEIENVGDAFETVLERVDLPAELEELGGNACIAEQLVTGTQFAPEGSVAGGEFAVHGVFHMRKDEAGTSFDRLSYPTADVPAEVQERAIDVSRRFLEHIGFDNGCFNSEFMWDEETGALSLIEFNTRISQSHSEMFLKVDGVSNHQVAVAVALGRTPRMPDGKGEFDVAGQYMIFHDEDAVVTRVPGPEEIAEVEKRHPGTVVTLEIAPGDRLSQLPGQDSYRYRLGKIYLGAGDHAEMDEKYARILDELDFGFDEEEQ
ncbi:ATP-grasp domain-containing protein [Brevibacterium sanguinis]|uniref:ATP-grasp domain-containing protein n=2 Tax=Brevibacterium TaxID=1696 RepID=A0A366ILC9_9MICO|nr:MULTISPECIES: ATP-grasp domain-containing protein [Brevibacterium]RBP65438.1 ATP-grasp domain-containing protein [Brevibacterium sanguinis]RBP72072.1 ATP-grasp domain-containing protein [Brevibacterium celere]